MKINVLTDRQICERQCLAIGSGREPWHDVGEARQCEHGRWWVATGREVEDRFYRMFQIWRPATWRERRRAIRAVPDNGVPSPHG